MPPCATCTPPRLCPAFVWRLSRLTPLTTILCLSGIVRSTSPCLPLSLPAMTITGSPGARSRALTLSFALFFSISFLEDLRGERDDLHEVALAKLARDRTEDAGPARVVRLRQEHGRVLVESDERSVRALVLLVHSHDDGLHHLALLDLTARLGGLDGGVNDVDDIGVFAVVPAGHADDQEYLRSRVVRDLEACFLLDHSLPGFLHDLETPPALLLRVGARFGDAHEVADAALVLLVVDLELGAVLQGLAVEAVRAGGADLDDDGLVHPVRDHVAQADLALAALRFFSCGLRGLGARRGLGGGVAHADSSFLVRRPRLGLGASSSVTSSCSAAAGGSTTATAVARGSASTVGWMPKSRSRSTVMIRAMSWRTLPIWLEFSSCPTACLKRSSYSSRRAVRRRMPSSSCSRTRRSWTFIIWPPVLPPRRRIAS